MSLRPACITEQDPISKTQNNNNNKKYYSKRQITINLPRVSKTLIPLFYNFLYYLKMPMLID